MEVISTGLTEHALKCDLRNALVVCRDALSIPVGRQRRGLLRHARRVIKVTKRRGIASGLRRR